MTSNGDLPDQLPAGSVWLDVKLFACTVRSILVISNFLIFFIIEVSYAPQNMQSFINSFCPFLVLCFYTFQVHELAEILEVYDLVFQLHET